MTIVRPAPNESRRRDSTCPIRWGPTTAVMPGINSSVVASAERLKAENFERFQSHALNWCFRFGIGLATRPESNDPAVRRGVRLRVVRRLRGRSLSRSSRAQRRDRHRCRAKLGRLFGRTDTFAEYVTADADLRGEASIVRWAFGSLEVRRPSCPTALGSILAAPFSRRLRPCRCDRRARNARAR